MLVSVIVPSHRPLFLREAVESALRQDGPEVEVVVVPNNGASVSGALPEDPRVRVVPYEGPPVVGAVKKFAFGAARGDVLVELDHDDLLAPGAAADIASAAGRPGFVYSNFAMFRDDGKRPTAYDAYWGWRHRPAQVLGRSVTEHIAFDPTPAAMGKIFHAPNHVRAWTRDAYRLAGGHDPTLPVCDDHDLLLRTHLAGVRMARLDRCAYLQREHEGNTSSERSAKILVETERLYRENIEALVLRWASDEGLPVFDGSGALDADTTGDQNCAFGTNALGAVVVSGQNSAFGHNALLVNSQSSNSAFGAGALDANTSGSGDAFGANALSASVTGANNAAFGTNALSLHTGSNCSAFGREALLNNTATSNNAFGFAALDQNTTGIRNCAFGTNALGANTASSDCAAFGDQALAVSTGANNSAFGSLSLLVDTTGQDNTACGVAALTAVTTGSDNTGLGRISGLTLTTGGQNTFLGSTSNTSSAAVANATAVGFGATVDASNLMVFGNASVTVVRPMSNGACDFGLTGSRWNNGWFVNVQVTGDNGLIFTNQTDGAGASAGTLGNAPSAGDPAFWIRVQVNGANRFVPAWA